jgi:hypothetical protein
MCVDISAAGVGTVGLDIGGKVDKIHLAQTIRNGCGLSSAPPEGKWAGTRTCPLSFLQCHDYQPTDQFSTHPYTFNVFISIWNTLITT